MKTTTSTSANTIQSFTDLKAWQKGHVLVLAIYKITDTFPSHERFGISNQLRRAAVSFTSNLAEGFSRNSYKEKLHFYTTALGSLTEIQNQILITRDVGYMDQKEFSKIADLSVEAGKVTSGFIRATKTKILNSRF